MKQVGMRRDELGMRTRLDLRTRAEGKGIDWGKLATTGGLYICEPKTMGDKRDYYKEGWP